MKIDVHGSCVSYNLIKKNDGIGLQWGLENVESNLFFSHVNIAGSMTKPISIIPKVDDFKEWNVKSKNHLVRNIIADLSKDAIIQLQHSEAQWLMIDFYDFARIQWKYEGGSYTHVADLSFVAPEYFKSISIYGAFRWIDMPEDVWYPLVDRYFETVMAKYGNNIILNRVNLNRFCLMEDGIIAEIPKNQAYLGSYADNEKIRLLEEYVISKYNLKTIDISKYFFADYANRQDILSVHYEQEYYLLGGKILKSILVGEGMPNDMMDMDSLRYKVMRSDILRPEFREVYFSKSPWHHDVLLDRLIAVMSPKEIEKNKFAILNTYEWLENHKEYLDSSELEDYEKQQILIHKFGEFCGCRGF